jgi:hypothetical protein
MANHPLIDVQSFILLAFYRRTWRKAKEVNEFINTQGIRMRALAYYILAFAGGLVYGGQV